MLMYLYCPTWYSSPGLDLATSMHAFPIPIANLECYGGRVLGRLRGVVQTPDAVLEMGRACSLEFISRFIS